MNSAVDLNSAVERSLCAPDDSIPVQAARTVGMVAAYFRKNDARYIAEDVQRYVRTHPEPMMIAAASVGLVLGAAFRWRNSA